MRAHGMTGTGIMRNLAPRPCAAVLASLGFAANASASDAPMLDTFSVNAGVFANNLDADLRVNGNSGRGTTIDLKRDLGVGGSRSLPFFSMTWRPFERHEFGVAYYQDDVSRTRTASRDITIRDNTYTAGTDISAKLNLESYGLGYRYWAWIGDQAAFGVGCGLEAYSFDLKLRGTAVVTGPDGSQSVVADAQAKASTDIPDPYIGFSYRYQLTDWARLAGDAGAFKANVGDIDATLYNMRFGLELYPWQNFGIVTQYSYNKIDADVSKTNFNGNATFRFSGVQVLFKFRY